MELVYDDDANRAKLVRDALPERVEAVLDPEDSLYVIVGVERAREAAAATATATTIVAVAR